MVPRAAEFAVLAAIFLDLLGFGMVVADFQLRAERLVPSGWPTGVVIGVLLASTFIIQLVVSPRWGRFSDQRGRKPALLACTALSALAMLVFGFADSVVWLLVSRLLAGLGSANVVVAQAWISDQHEGPQRTAALGRISAAVSTGLVVGPPLGGFLSLRGGNLAIGLTAGIASLLGLAWLAVSMPDTPPKAAQEPGKRAAIDVSLLGRAPMLRPMFVIATVAWFSLAMLEGTFARLIQKLYGYGQLEFGWIFGFEALLGIIVSGHLLGWMTTRVEERRLLTLAYLAQGVGLALNPFAASILPALAPLVILFLASTFFAWGSGVANPTVNAICSRLTPDAQQGELFGLLQGARAVGFVLGPILGGALFDASPITPYLLAGGVCLLAAMLVPRIAPSPATSG